MNFQAFILKFFNLKQEEYGKFGLLFFHSFFLGLLVSFHFVPSNAIFIKHFGFKYLPVAYMFAGLMGYLSTSQLQSTVTGLGSMGYISTSQLQSTISSIFSPNTYVSTGALVSTTAGISTNLQTNFYVDRLGNLIMNNGSVYISSVNNLLYFSTFVFSSITYQGTNGSNNGLIYGNTNMIFSTALLRFDNFSSYIQPTTKVIVDIYPNIVFNELNTGATSYQYIPMSTYMSCFAPNNTFSNIYSSITTSWIFGQNKTTGFGNFFNTQMKLTIPAPTIMNNYMSNFIVCHNVVNGITYSTSPGLKSNVIDIRFSSTNSVFLTIQNLQ